MTSDQVILVTAPVLSVLRPGLGVSTLKAELEREGISTGVEYLNLDFADRIGVELNEFLAYVVPNRDLVGEWIFSSMIREACDQAQEAWYLRRLEHDIHHSQQLGDPLMGELQFDRILDLREVARDFVEQWARRLAVRKPKILGFSTMFQQTVASLAVAARVRELDPEIVICFGGANCEGPMGRALLASYPQIDYVFSGEADRSFPAFVRACLAGEKPSPDPSVFSRESTAGCESSPIFDLDTLPIPDFSDYFDVLERVSFRDRMVPGLMIETSRGCWWGAKKHCRFCGLNGSTMVFRAKSPARVVEEIDYLYETWRVPRFQVADNIMDLKHAKSVFRLLGERRKKYHFFYEIKSNMNMSELTDIARGGVTWVQPGIESLDDDILKLMQKGVSALQNIRALRNCAELGVAVTWNILFGFPGERPEQYQRMAELVPALEHFDPPNECNRVRLDRFSPYYEQAAEFGFVDVRPGPACEIVFGLPAEVLAELTYSFESGHPEIGDAEYIKSLSQAVSNWRRRFIQDRDLPVLSLFRMGPLTAAKDTRTCAGQTWRVLEQEEVQVLNAFRDPGNAARAVQKLRDETQEETDFQAAFDRLVEWQYLVVDNDSAVSIVLDPAYRVHPPETMSIYPGGWLINEDTPAPVDDETEPVLEKAPVLLLLRSEAAVEPAQ